MSRKPRPAVKPPPASRAARRGSGAFEPGSSEPTAVPSAALPPPSAAAPAASEGEPADTRTRLLDTAAALVAAVGPAHVDRITTRAVCEAAGVTAPTLYHHFGDKDGLVAAVVARTAEAFLAAKEALAPSEDPVEDVRRGWDAWVAFALAHPALFALTATSPRAGPEATAAAHARLCNLLERVDAAGRLALPHAVAAEVVWGAAQGMTALLVQRAYADRPLDDVLRVSATLREAVLTSVIRPIHRLAAASEPRGGRTGAPRHQETKGRGLG